MQTKKAIYWITTAILCGIMLYSAYMYFTKTEMIKGFFKSFNHPTYVVIPLGILKVIGVAIVLWRPIKWVTDWVYAGFFFNLVLATAAHYYAGHDLGFSLYALLALFPSYFLGKYIRD